MKFEDILGNGTLWATVYDEGQGNILNNVFGQWTDIDYLEGFFANNIADLQTYFNITDLDLAIYDTITDAIAMKCMILDLKEDVPLDYYFRPLENYRTNEMILSREKAKGVVHKKHPSWLRLYALKFDNNTYLITGGAIKLTHTMAEREHTLKELQTLEKVRSYLIENGVTDIDGLKELASI